MKATLFAVAMLAVSGSVAFAGGNPAIANHTTTSMGAPPSSPGYRAARSEAVPGLPPQARRAQERNEAMNAHPTQAPINPITNNAQLSR